MSLNKLLIHVNQYIRFSAELSGNNHFIMRHIRLNEGSRCTDSYDKERDGYKAE